MSDNNKWGSARTPATGGKRKLGITPSTPIPYTDDDADESSGEYECIVCGYDTDIPNAHGPETQHWCRGECDGIQTFTKANNE